MQQMLHKKRVQNEGVARRDLCRLHRTARATDIILTVTK